MYKLKTNTKGWCTADTCIRIVRSNMFVFFRGRPKWILLADQMADVSVTTSADVRSDPMFLDITVICMQWGPFVSD